MSEKRFTDTNDGIYDNQEKRLYKITAYDFFDCETDEVVFECEKDEVVDLLNEQQATIKSKDKQLERLYNYFQYYLKDEMSGNAFSEMWDFVKEDEEWEDE